MQRQEEKRMDEKDDGISRITFIDFLARVFPDNIGSCRRIFNLYGNPTVVLLTAYTCFPNRAIWYQSRKKRVREMCQIELLYRIVRQKKSHKFVPLTEHIVFPREKREKKSSFSFCFRFLLRIRKCVRKPFFWNKENLFFCRSRKVTFLSTRPVPSNQHPINYNIPLFLTSWVFGCVSHTPIPKSLRGFSPCFLIDARKRRFPQQKSRTYSWYKCFL